MRRVPGRLGQGPVLAVAVAAVIVLAAGVLAVVTWASGSATGQPAAQAGAPSAGTAQPAGASSAGSPSASASGQGQQRGQLAAGNVASVPMSALPAGGAARSGRIVALVIVSGVPSVSVRVAAMPGTLVRAATGGVRRASRPG
jgi:hypothetical protein